MMTVMVMVMMTLTVGIVALVVVVVMVLVMMLVVLTLIVVMMMVALTIGIVALVIVVVMVLVMMLVGLTLIVVMMMVALTIGIVALVIVVVMMLVVLALIVVMMMVALTLGIVTLMIVVMVVMLVFHASQLVGEGVVTLDRMRELLAVKSIPRSRHDGSLFIVLAQKGNAAGQLVLGQAIGVAEHDGVGVLNLITEKLTEIFHIQAALACVNDGSGGSQDHLIGQHAGDGADDVGQFADARGLDEDAVGGEIAEHLLQCLGEIADKRAADAALIHLGNLHTALLEKA
jgi:hypothetical protein